MRQPFMIGSVTDGGAGPLRPTSIANLKTRSRKLQVANPHETS